MSQGCDHVDDSTDNGDNHPVFAPHDEAQHMKIQLLAWPFFLLIALAPAVHAQEVDEIDPVSVSPGIFTVILENEHVRVVEYVLDPGQRDQWHTHPPKVSYVLGGGSLRIRTEDGNSFIAEEKPGTASWMNSLGRHYAENVGKTAVRILLVEVKAIQ